MRDRCQAAERERDEARAEVERLRGELAALREVVQHAADVAADAAAMRCTCHGYYRCGTCPDDVAARAEDAEEILRAALREGGNDEQ